MNKIQEKLKQLKKEKRIGLMTHVVVGYPGLDKTISIVKTMEKYGADFVELQIPFSDPLADGPTIMHACEVALKNGTRVKDAFAVAKKLSAEVDTPLLFMGYYNPIFVYGVEKFCRDSRAAGISGFIIPDIPFDEEKYERYYFYCHKYDLYNIQVVSPVSTEVRLKKNASIACGFVYCVARKGTTGAKGSLDYHLFDYLKKVKKYFSLPLAVGFGISKKEHIEYLKGKADIAIIGSEIIEMIDKSKERDINKNVMHFVSNLLSPQKF